MWMCGAIGITQVEGPTEADHSCQKVWSYRGIIRLLYLTEVVVTHVVIDDEAENVIQDKS